MKNKPMDPSQMRVTDSGATVWLPSNVYPSARLARGVNVGRFTEIGHKVVIGSRTRIGAFCFIPELVTIGRDCFIAPRVTFTNDKFPPQGREKWLGTIVCDGARIGSGCIIICGITIGKGAFIGAGSLVTRNVGEGEIWYGHPARRIGHVGDLF